MNYHDAPADVYQAAFKERCLELSNLLSTMESIFDSNNVSLVELGPEVSWNIFDCLSHRCDQDMMAWTKKNNPEKFKESSAELLPYISTTEMAENICSLKETVQLLSDNMEKIKGCLDNLTAVVMEMVPPPAEAPGVDEEALHSEYYIQTPAAPSAAPGAKL